MATRTITTPATLNTGTSADTPAVAEMDGIWAYDGARSGPMPKATAFAQMQGGIFETFRKYGAVGDGVADDTAAVQAALDASAANGLEIIGFPGDVYKITAELSFASNTRVDFRGATLLRGFKDTWLIASAEARTVNYVTNVVFKNMSLADDGTNATRGNFLLAAGVKEFTLDGFKVRASSTNIGMEAVGAWCSYFEGEDIAISGVDVDSVDCGLYSDGLHFGQVTRCTVASGYNIRAGDDGIALHFPPSAYGFTNRHGKASGITIGAGYVESATSNGLRIGAWSASGGSDDASHWDGVTVTGMTFGTCAAQCINLTDDRAAADITTANDNIHLHGINFGTNATNRLLNITGNPDITNAANYAQKNYKRVTISAAAGTKAGTTDEPIRAGGVEALSLRGFDIECSDDVSDSTGRVRFLQVDRLDLSAFAMDGNTTGTLLTLTYVADAVLSDVRLRSGTGSPFYGVVVNLNTDQATSLRVYGGEIRDVARGIFALGTGTLSEVVLSGVDIVASFLTTNAALEAATRFVGGPTVFGGRISAAGTATNVPLTLAPKGAGVVNVTSIPTHADDATAGAAGRVAGDLYKTATGEVRVKL